MTNPFSAPSDHLFATTGPKEEKRFGNVYNGRYHMAPLDDPNAWIPGGAQRHVPRGAPRSSNLASALSDTRALNLWEQRAALDGLRKSIVLQEELSVLRDPSDADLNAFFDKVKAEGGGTEGARRGTARHDMLEEWLTTGREIGTSMMRLQLAVIKQTLRDHLLVPVPELTERVVYNDIVNCAGRLDGAVIDLQTGKLHIDDLKTKRRQFWTMLEVRTQLAIYVYSTAMWDPIKLCYVDMPTFDLDEGYVIHLPVDGELDESREPTGENVCHILTADLRRGWETAQLARRVVDARSESKSVGTLRGAVRPHPGMSVVELYARRFASVAAREDGSALVAECLKLGVWCDELAQAASDAAVRIDASKDLEIGS